MQKCTTCSKTKKAGNGSKNISLRSHSPPTKLDPTNSNPSSPKLLRATIHAIVPECCLNNQNLSYNSTPERINNVAVSVSPRTKTKEVQPSICNLGVCPLGGACNDPNAKPIIKTTQTEPNKYKAEQECQTSETRIIRAADLIFVGRTPRSDYSRSPMMDNSNFQVISTKSSPQSVSRIKKIDSPHMYGPKKCSKTKLCVKNTDSQRSVCGPKRTDSKRSVSTPKQTESKGKLCVKKTDSRRSVCGPRRTDSQRSVCGAKKTDSQRSVCPPKKTESKNKLCVRKTDSRRSVCGAKKTDSQRSVCGPKKTDSHRNLNAPKKTESKSKLCVRKTDSQRSVCGAKKTDSQRSVCPLGQDRPRKKPVTGNKFTHDQSVFTIEQEDHEEENHVIQAQERLILITEAEETTAIQCDHNSLDENDCKPDDEIKNRYQSRELKKTLVFVDDKHPEQNDRPVANPSEETSDNESQPDDRTVIYQGSGINKTGHYVTGILKDKSPKRSAQTSTTTNITKESKYITTLFEKDSPIINKEWLLENNENSQHPKESKLNYESQKFPSQPNSSPASHEVPHFNKKLKVMPQQQQTCLGPFTQIKLPSLKEQKNNKTVQLTSTGKPVCTSKPLKIGKQCGIHYTPPCQEDENKSSSAINNITLKYNDYMNKKQTSHVMDYDYNKGPPIPSCKPPPVQPKGVQKSEEHEYEQYNYCDQTKRCSAPKSQSLVPYQAPCGYQISDQNAEQVVHKNMERRRKSTLYDEDYYYQEDMIKEDNCIVQ